MTNTMTVKELMAILAKHDENETVWRRAQELMDSRKKLA